MINGIDHIVLRVMDLARATAHWENVFGLVADRVVENPQLGIKQAFLPLPEGAFVELIAPLSEESPLNGVLRKRGEGVHLVSFRVNDAAAAIENWKANGAEVHEVTNGPAFVLPKSANGTMIGAAGADT